LNNHYKKKGGKEKKKKRKELKKEKEKEPNLVGGCLEAQRGYGSPIVNSREERGDSELHALSDCPKGNQRGARRRGVRCIQILELSQLLGEFKLGRLMGRWE